MSKFLDLNGLTSLKKKIESWIDTKVSELSKGLIYMDVECSGGVIYLSSSGSDGGYPSLELHQGYIINANCHTAPEYIADIVIDVKSGEIYLVYVIYDSKDPDQSGSFYCIEGVNIILMEAGSSEREVNANALHFIYRIK